MTISRLRVGVHSIVIHTQYKAPLPKAHSYPIGAQAVSDALENVPQSAALRISFHKMQQSSAGLLVFEASYRRWHVGLSAADFMIERGEYEPQWALIVYAVPREIRQNVKNAIRSTGLPVVAKWISAFRTETWRDSSHSLELVFDSDEAKLSAIDS